MLYVTNEFSWQHIESQHEHLKTLLLNSSHFACSAVSHAATFSGLESGFSKVLAEGLELCQYDICFVHIVINYNYDYNLFHTFIIRFFCKKQVGSTQMVAFLFILEINLKLDSKCSNSFSTGFSQPRADSQSS